MTRQPVLSVIKPRGHPAIPSHPTLRCLTSQLLQDCHEGGTGGKGNEVVTGESKGARNDKELRSGGTRAGE